MTSHLQSYLSSFAGLRGWTRLVAVAAVGMMWAGTVVAEPLRTGSVRLRDKGRQLAEQFTRETRSDVDLRNHGMFFSIERRVPQIGDEEQFFIDKTDSGKRKPYPATLKCIGSKCYVYVEKGVTVADKKLEAIVKQFDEKIYPTTTEWFGKEWSPGIDGDPRITLLIVTGLQSCDGYFDPEDEYTREKRSDSNEREMLTLSVERLESSGVDEFMGHLVAHEFQHLIHWSHDPKEATWVDEGCAEFSATLFGQFPFTYEAFLKSPERCLIDWDDDENASNYGHVFMFMDYLITHAGARIGERKKLVNAIVASRRTSVQGVEEALRGMQVPMAFNTFFREFCVATYLNRAYEPAQGPYAYDAYVAERLVNVKANPVRPKFCFDAPAGTRKNKMKMWSSRAYSFKVPAAVDHLAVSFSGEAFEGMKGRNSFDVGVAFAHSRRQQPPQVVWLPVAGNDVDKIVPVPTGFDRALLVIVNRGPMKLPANEKQWPPIGYTFKVGPAEVAASQARFDALHREP